MTDSLFRPIGGYSAPHLPRRDPGGLTHAPRPAGDAGGAGLSGDGRARYAQPATAALHLRETKHPLVGRDAQRPRDTSGPPIAPPPEEGPVGPPPTFPINLLEAEARRRQESESLLDRPPGPTDPPAPFTGAAAAPEAAPGDPPPEALVDADRIRPGQSALTAFERAGERSAIFPDAPGAGTLNLRV